MDAWRRLGQRRPAFGQLRGVLAGEGVDALAAVDHEGARHLLLPIATEDLGYADDRSRGVEAQTRALVVEGQPLQVFIDLGCRDAANYRLFDTVIEDILEQLGQGVRPAEAVRLILARWRRFWGATPEEAPTREQLISLFGELWFLVVHVLPQGTEQIRRWTGPTGSRHDFQWPTHDVEVKTTLAGRHVHTVHGIEQMDPPSGGELFVFSLRVREEQAAANTPQTLIDRVAGLISSDADAVDLFERQLLLVGYSPAHRRRYEEMRLQVADERLYRVAEGFPRLTRASFAGGMPPGVGRVRYEIDLDVCPGLIVPALPQTHG